MVIEICPWMKSKCDMKKIFLIFNVLAVAFTMAACGDDVTEPDYYSSKTTDGFVVTDQSVFSVGAATLETAIDFSSNMWWTLEVVDADGNPVDEWIDVSPRSGRGNTTLQVATDPNFIMQAREVQVRIEPDGENDQEPISFTVRQEAAAPFIDISGVEIENGVMNIGVVGASADIRIHANMEWTVDNTEVPWFELSSPDGGGPNTVDEVQGIYQSNATGDYREGDVIFRGPDGFTRKLHVKQKDKFDVSALTANNGSVLSVSWTPVIGTESYALLLTDADDTPVGTIENIARTQTEYDLTEYFGSDYVGVVNVAVKAVSADPEIYSVSEKVLTHSHFADDSGDGSAGHEYLIANMRHLNNIAKLGELDKHYRQIADLDFSQETGLVPIGDAATRFTGTYSGAKEGGGKYKLTGRNCVVSNAKTSLSGLFGVIGDGAVVSDLIFERCTLDLQQGQAGSPAGFAHVVGAMLGGTVRDIEIVDCEIALNTFAPAVGVGAVAGYCGAGEEPDSFALIESCTTAGGQINTDDKTAKPSGYFAGGIAGLGVEGTMVRNCHNLGTPLTTRAASTGGVVGEDISVIGCSNRAPIYGGTRIGGIIGFIGKAEVRIEKSFNSGRIGLKYANAASFVGGIVGRANCSKNTVISECFNSGDAISDVTNRPSVFGGIIGQADQSVDIHDCYNTGAVTLPSDKAAARAGGIAGSAPGASNISRCYTTGTVSAGEKADLDKGERCAVAGECSANSAIAHVYYLSGAAEKALSGTPGMTDLREMSESELGAVGGYDASWDFTTVWTAPSGAYPYPQLRAVSHVSK